MLLGAVPHIKRALLIMHSIIYSLYMWLLLCIILAVFCTGLKVNVMRITLHGGDSNTQYTPYCGNQHPVRLLVMVLLYFLWVQCHEYVAAVMVLSWKYSSTYGLTLMR